MFNNIPYAIGLLGLSSHVLSAPHATTRRSSGSGAAAAVLPSPSQFTADKSIKWSVELVGPLKYTGSLGSLGANCDKARSSFINGKHLWNTGDMECSATWCGFSMGAGFPASDVLTVDTLNKQALVDVDFVDPWSDDPAPVKTENDCSQWGMDNSNAAPISDTEGIVFSWEIWRLCGADNTSIVDRGLAASLLTFDGDTPTTERKGALLTDGSGVASGLNGALASDGYVYNYVVEGTTTYSGGTMFVGRAKTDDPSIFTDASAYEYLKKDGTWAQGIPKKTDTAIYGMTSQDPDGGFYCSVYGSAYYNSYLDKFMLMCNVNYGGGSFYLCDTPYDGCSARYDVAADVLPESYGLMAHPDFSPNGDHSQIYFTLGPNANQQIYKISFEY